MVKGASRLDIPVNMFNKMANFAMTPQGYAAGMAMASGAGGEWVRAGYERTNAYGIQPAGFAEQLGFQQYAGGIRHNYAIQSAEGQLALHQDYMVLTKELRGLNESMIQANRNYSMQSIGFSMERAGLSLSQGMESIALSERTWQAQRAYQLQEMNIGRQQFGVQAGWRREDFSYQQSMAGLQYGWQQEDLERAIRFSTGRERQNLIRQRERSQISYTMQQGQAGRERSRFETQTDWQEASFERQKTYFDQMGALQKEQFDMQRKHLTQNYELTMRQLAAQMAYQQEMWGLEDAQRKLQYEYDDKRLAFTEGELEKQVELSKLAKDEFELQMKWQVKRAEGEKEYQDFVLAFLDPDSPAYSMWRDFFNWMQSKINEFTGSGQPAGPTQGQEKNGLIWDGVKWVPKDQYRGPATSTANSLNLRTDPTRTNDKSAVNVQVFIGDREITDIVATKITTRATFEKGVNALAQRQRNVYAIH
jgi:hypothetical protein